MLHALHFKMLFYPKLCVLAQFGGTVGLIGMTFTGSNTTVAVILMTATVATNSGHYCGFLSNHLDLSPNFAGVLMGITNCISNTFSFLAPLTAGFILKDEVNKIICTF